MAFPAPRLPRGLLARPTGVGLKRIPRKGINPAMALKAKQAMHGRGKYVAAAVAGGVLINGMKSRSGRAVDPVRGRQTGIYGF